MHLLTVVLADVVSGISPIVFVENNLFFVFTNRRTPIALCVVMEF